MNGGGACEIGSVPFQNATWLFATLSNFHVTYGLIHPYIAVILCFAGTILNVMTVAVLTRPSMISPVNVLLCSVAICDILVMASYLIFVTHFLINAANRCLHTDYSYPWTIFTLIHAHASVILHSTSIWLTVLLAQIRVLTIRRSTLHPSTTVTIRFTVLLSIATCIIMSLFNLPNFLTFKVVRTSPELFLPCLVKYSKNSSLSLSIDNDKFDDDYSQQNLEYVDDSDDEYPVYMLVASQGNCMKLKLAFWSNGILFKVVPCFLLTVSIIVLVKVIADLSNQRRTLAQLMKRKVPKDHTTPMLVAVLSIFLITELPQGVMNVLTGIFTGDTFHQKVYLPLGDFMDLLSLINSAVNFLIYCIMNKRFRITFLQLFCDFCPNRKLSRIVEDYSRVEYAYESSRQPNRSADISRTEQLMLTSQHRPSSVSVFTNLSSTREEQLKNQRKFTGNLLTVEDNHYRRMTILAKQDESKKTCNHIIKTSF
uniref:G_PROTEIN_RECEP_F1_2 domain-containing protein n=3 Tax=Onchocerca TaxID=6281 RepID=A0A8R1TYW7_ONCVO